MFNYTQLDGPTAELVQAETAAIKQLAKPAAQAALEIGQHLLTVKAALPHGHFLPWLQAEFTWSERTARNYMRIAERFKSAKFSDLNISLSALHLLCGADSETVESAFTIARQDGGLTYTRASQLVYPDSAYIQPNPELAAGRRQPIILGDDPDPADDPDYVEFVNVLPLTRITAERRERATFESVTTITVDLPGDHARELPKHLQQIIRIDPLMVAAEPRRIEAAIEQLQELYRHLTGRFYLVGAA